MYIFTPVCPSATLGKVHGCTETTPLRAIPFPSAYKLPPNPRDGVGKEEM